MAGVRFEKVRKAFGAAVAVDDLDLDIASGEFVSLLGPSGCGKTTTLRMLAGLEYPTSGRILIGERMVNETPPSRRDIAMVFQSYALYPHMTVAGNIAYPLRKRGVSKSERGPKVMAAAKLLQIEALLDRKPKELSGGQQQRVALGRALVRDPQVFLLDEPLSNLDAKLRAHMRAELIELHGRIGKTMVYVTHDQLEAMTMSTRIAVMKSGLLQQYAAPSEIYNRPANVFVAGFIGTPSMTLTDGQLVRQGDQAMVRAGGLALSLPPRHLAGKAEPGPVTLGIRPEDVLVGSGDHDAAVKVVEPTGHESIVLLDVGGAVMTARVPADIVIRAGERVKVGFRLPRLHLFHGTTGLRLNSDELDLSEPNRVAAVRRN